MERLAIRQSIIGLLGFMILPMKKNRNYSLRVTKQISRTGMQKK